MNWVDIFLLILFVKSAVQGFSRGFILAAFKTAGVAVALYAGIFYRERVVEFLKSKFAFESFIKTFLNIPVSPTSGSKAAAALKNSALLDMGIKAVGFFVAFIGIQVIFMVIAYFLEGLVKLSHLTPLNRLLGIAFGIIRTAILIALVSTVISPFLMAWQGSWLEKNISGSYILMNMKLMDFITPVVVKLI